MTPRLRMIVALSLWPLLALAAEPAPAPVAAPPPPPEINATAYILIDFDTGDVLAEKNVDQRVPPASLTKIMTSYIAAREIESGRIHLDRRCADQRECVEARGTGREAVGDVHP